MAEGPYTKASVILSRVYPNSISSEVGGCNKDIAVEYNLSRQWRMFHATVGLNDDSTDTDTRVDFQVYVDGVQAGSGYDLDIGEQNNIEVPVSGKFRLKIEMVLLQGDMGLCSDAGDAVWGDARLVR